MRSWLHAQALYGSYTGKELSGETKCDKLRHAVSLIANHPFWW